MRMSTYERWCWYFCYHISTHDLTRRSIYSSFLSTFKCTVFQLTTSRGGRLTFSSLLFARYSFQLTTSQGGRLSWWKIKYTICTISTHDLARRSTGKNQLLIVSLRISTHDLARRSTRILPLILHQSPRISTHDLARRSTNHTNHPYFRIFISTHDLVRRSTILDAGAEVLKIFQLTTSWGGRISFRNFKCKVPGISTHDLAKRSTPAADESVQMPKLFQLTTSQGGRH